MKIRYGLCVPALLASLVLGANALPAPEVKEQSQPIAEGLRVFTCGNSFHAWFNAPILKEMAGRAEIKGHEIVGISNIGRSRAIRHWDVSEEKNEAKAALRQGNTDDLNPLLQEIAWATASTHTLSGSAPASSPKPQATATRDTSMEGKVFVGYQGWFTPFREEDGAKWIHYGSRDEFKPGLVSVEMWPDTTELGDDEKVPTDFRRPDGGVAHVFSSQNAKTVSRHFAWMKQYGIDGAFLQRFGNPAANPKERPSLDRVLANVRAASASNGIAWGLMYDLSGVRAEQVFPKISEDWKRLAGELKIRADPYYVHHRGKPVVVLWGIGFSDNRPAPKSYLNLIQFLKDDPTYGGNTVILGVPFYWRTGRNDAVDDPALKEAILAADVIAPWPVGRYSDPDGAARLAKSEREPDARWAVENGRDYLPGIFPGFSWSNLMKTRGKESRFNQIPRRDGSFLWTQAVSAQRAGAKMLYVAMFDEIDEGTAIFKVANEVPVGETPFLTYEGLPSDHYLWLTGQIGRMLRGEIPARDEMPAR